MRHIRGMRAPLLALAACLLAACTSTATSPPTAAPTGRRPAPTEATFKLSDLVKSDIDAVAEVHLRESIASAKLLMEKLYRRNPRELRKTDLPTPEAGVARAFDPRYAWHSRSCRTSGASMPCRRLSGRTSRATASSPLASASAA